MADCLYDLLFMLPICLITDLLAAAFLQGPEHSVWIYVVSVFSLGIFVLIKHWKNRIRYLFPGIALSAVVTVILLQPAGERTEFILRNLWVLWAFLIGTGSFFLGYFVAAVRTVRRIFIPGTAVLMVLNLFFRKIDSKPAVALAFFLILLFVADEIQHRWKKSGYPDVKKHLVYIAPFLLITGIAVFQIPAPEKPLDWTFAVRAAKQAFSYVKENTVWMHTGEDYNAEVGFSEEGIFYGNLSGKSKEMMQLKADTGGENTVYLNGKTMDTFNGREWTENYTEENNDRRADTIELLAAVENYDAEHTTDYIRRTNITLTFRDFYTKYCFAPIKAVPGESGFGNVEWTQKGGDLIASRQLGYKKNYLVSYYRQNRGNEKFKGLLEHSSVPDEKTWDSVNRRYAAAFTVPYGDYLDYRKKVYEFYLPETPLSPDSEKYLAKITEDAGSDYEKCCRIRDVFASMAYTKTPGELPVDVNSPERFMDYFMFEKQEGYCFYYATAFVLAVRNQGLPARLVQGYRVSAIPGKTVGVKSDSAHAWAEVYFDGIGWVVFDPTPGAPEDGYWMTEEEGQKTPASSPAGMELPEKKDPQAPTELPSEHREKKTAFHWQMVWIPVSAAILLLILYLAAERLIGQMKYRNLSTEEKFLSACRKNIRILEYLGYRMEAGETPQEYGVRIMKKLEREDVAFIVPYERYCYADEIPGEEELTLVGENTKKLLRELKKAKGKRYFLYYFRLMKYT